MSEGGAIGGQGFGRDDSDLPTCQWRPASGPKFVLCRFHGRRVAIGADVHVRKGARGLVFEGGTLQRPGFNLDETNGNVHAA